jgi:molybdopterin biosynthesis enzyme
MGAAGDCLEQTPEPPSRELENAVTSAKTRFLARRIQSAVLIPNADRATIDAAKLRDYLLSATHPVGRFKARFFTALGFTPDRWEELVEALRIQHLTQDGQSAGPTDRGQKYTIRAILNGPTGQSAVVVSVWFIPTGGEMPRFVTAFPGDGR